MSKGLYGIASIALLVTFMLWALAGMERSASAAEPVSSEAARLVLGGTCSKYSCYRLCGSSGCINGACGDNDEGEWCGSGSGTGDAWECLHGYGTSTSCQTGDNTTNCSAKQCHCQGKNNCTLDSTGSSYTGHDECNDN